MVEYALRDAAKPMGVAAYRVSPALPARLEAELPTVQDLTREFPLMSVVRLRVEIERELRVLLEKRGVQTRRLGIGQMLQELNRDGALPPSARDFELVLRAMNDAAHGVEIDPNLAAEAVQVGSSLLQELTRTVRSATAPS